VPCNRRAVPPPPHLIAAAAARDTAAAATAAATGEARYAPVVETRVTFEIFFCAVQLDYHCVLMQRSVSWC